ncbi:MAG: hypothetical protein IJ583_04810 [Firmicutes bacterium]|nr:hypothetical protein [Bacillota bacterium]
MRKSLLKTLIATAIISAVTIFSSAIAFAETAMFKIPDTATNDTKISSALTVDTITYHPKDGCKYNVPDTRVTIAGESFKGGINMAGKTSSSKSQCYFSFSLSEDTDITIYYASFGSNDTDIGVSNKVGNSGYLDSVTVKANSGTGSKTFCVTGINTVTNYYICTSDSKATFYGIKLEPHKTSNSAKAITSANAPEGDQYAVDSTYSYIIHTVTADEMNYESLAIADSTDNIIAGTSTNTVYSRIIFPDGSSINAPENSYIYAVKVDKTSAPTSVNYKWVNNH